MPRQVKAPTVWQWGCAHDWRVRQTKRWPGPWPAKHRNYRCARCGLAVVTEERPAVPWDERTWWRSSRRCYQRGSRCICGPWG